MYTESFYKFREMNYREIEGDATSITNACEVWLSVLSSKHLEPYKDKVEKRFQQAMTPSQYLANIYFCILFLKAKNWDHVT